MLNLKNLVLIIVCTYLITAVHHVYGAWLYETPWRNHIVSQGAVWIIICFIFLAVYKYLNQKWAYWIFFVMSFFFFLGVLSLYEGFYNHVLKNILYYGELPESMLLQLYPSPRYEMPNDLIFEITGVLTFVIGGLSGYIMIQYTRLFITNNPHNKP